MMARKKKEPTPAFPEIEANRHQDTRKNIPTEELRDFVADDEAKPKTMLYPRDPSLDPQLVWKGKDEQDRRTARSRRRADLHPGSHRAPRHHRSHPAAEDDQARQQRLPARLLRRLRWAGI